MTYAIISGLKEGVDSIRAIQDGIGYQALMNAVTNNLGVIQKPRIFLTDKATISFSNKTLLNVYHIPLLYDIITAPYKAEAKVKR